MTGSDPGQGIWPGGAGRWCCMSSGADDPPGRTGVSGVLCHRWHILGWAVPAGITLPKAPGTGGKAWGHLTHVGCPRLVAFTCPAIDLSQ